MLTGWHPASGKTGDFQIFGTSSASVGLDPERLVLFPLVVSKSAIRETWRTWRTSN